MTHINRNCPANFHFYSIFAFFALCTVLLLLAPTFLESRILFEMLGDRVSHDTMPAQALGGSPLTINNVVANVGATTGEEKVLPQMVKGPTTPFSLLSPLSTMNNMPLNFVGAIHSSNFSSGGNIPPTN